MGFEIFDSKEFRRKGSAPIASIRRDGKIRLNGQAGTILKNAGVEQVLLLWDRDKRKLAISAAPEGDTRAYKVSYERFGSASLGAKAFTRFIGWHSDHTVKLPLEQTGRMLEVTIPAEYLEETPQEPTGRDSDRKRKAGARFQERGLKRK